jgi:hypothetical protein
VRSAVTGGAAEIGEARGGDGLPERNGVGKALDKWHECPSYRLATQGGKKNSRSDVGAWVRGDTAAMANGARAQQAIPSASEPVWRHASRRALAGRWPCLSGNGEALRQQPTG